MTSPWERPGNYNTSYYQQFWAIRQEPMKKLAGLIVSLYTPRSVLDMGCGEGTLVSCLEDLGVHTLGVDWSPAAMEMAKTPFLLHDLRHPIVLAHFDVTVSLEAAEHVPAEYVDVFVGNISQSPFLLFSAAPPGVPGLYHIHCQPMSWWENKLGDAGLVPDPQRQPSMDEAMGDCPVTWYRNIRCLRGKI